MENKKQEKPKKGRPAKEKEKLDHSINVKLTEADFNSVKEKAGQLGMKTTIYARQMVLKGRVKSRFSLEELDLMRKLSGIANNLNQIARKANQAGFAKVGVEAIGLINRIKSLIHDS